MSSVRPDASGPGVPSQERVVELRRTSLERSGYSSEQARELASRLELPLQQALQPIKAGFPPDVAYEMLTSGERPVF